ncbi:D-alanyl-D-alanine carboxypeptidase family protein [Agromyces protaetiae]|nr:D-alanyl-D-alanine carboxypeptidase [Agromyces protaetiae]
MSHPTAPDTARAAHAGHEASVDPAMRDGRDSAREAARLAKKRMYRRRRIVVFSVLAVVLALFVSGGVYVSNALGAPIPEAQPAIVDPEPVAEPAQPLAVPGFGSWAIAAVGFDGLLAQSDDQSVLPMASIAKVVTSLVVLDQHPIPAGEGGESIAYTDADVDIYWDMIAQNGSVAPVEAGATLTLKESLEAMLLPSGNNYAISIANWAFGSEAAYADAANAWLAAHGFTETHIADASGLSLDSTSTARELVKLGELALQTPALAEIVAMPHAEIPEIGGVDNSNKLLGTHGVDGIKTGTTDDAANLLYSADYPVGDTTVTLVGVVLNADDHAQIRAAVAALLDSVAPGFHQVTALTAGTELASYTTPWGDDAVARATDGATVLVWSDTPVDVSVQVNPITLADVGTRVGTATITAGAQTIEVPITLDGEIDDPGTWWRLQNPGVLDAAGAK